MAHIGHPIIGCDMYAHPAAFEYGHRLHLHAYALAFQHPTTQAPIEIQSEINFV